MVSFCFRGGVGGCTLARFSLQQKYPNSYTTCGFCSWYFISNSKPHNYNVNCTYLQDIKSCYAQMRPAGSSRMPGLDEFQVIEEDTPEVETSIAPITGVSIHEVATATTISSPRRGP